jgi:type IV secretory pathway protease TraF
MSIVEIRTTRVGKGKSSRMAKMVLVDGHDISADVLSVDVHLDSKGNDIATVTLIAALVETELAIVELSEETKSGLKAMGYIDQDDVVSMLRTMLQDPETNIDETDGRLDFTAAQAIVAKALADLGKWPTP